jgi:hypothetical protein
MLKRIPLLPTADEISEIDAALGEIPLLPGADEIFCIDHASEVSCVIARIRRYRTWCAAREPLTACGAFEYNERFNGSPG